MFKERVVVVVRRSPAEDAVISILRRGGARIVLIDDLSAGEASRRPEPGLQHHAIDAAHPIGAALVSRLAAEADWTFGAQASPGLESEGAPEGADADPAVAAWSAILAAAGSAPGLARSREDAALAPGLELAARLGLTSSAVRFLRAEGVLPR